MTKTLSTTCLLFVLCLFSCFGYVSSVAAQTSALLPRKPVQQEALLDGAVTLIKGANISVKASDKKVYSLKFAAKVSMVGPTGKTIVKKDLRVGDRIRASGTVKGLTFTVSRLRVSQSASTVSTTKSVATYTMAQVATHKDASSCWAVIDGGVYDLTAWIGRHPGGREAILGLCGTDGSAAFHGQHGSEGQPAAALATFKVGTLQK